VPPENIPMPATKSNIMAYKFLTGSGTGPLYKHLRYEESSSRDLGHIVMLAAEDHTVGDIPGHIQYENPEQESSSRDLGHIVMMAAKNHTVGDITVKTTELREIAVKIDAARDWEDNFEEFGDMRDSPDASCMMEEIPEASRNYQKVWFCKEKKKTANLLRSLLQCLLPTYWTTWTLRWTA
jgi:hypothetical protein